MDELTKLRIEDTFKKRMISQGVKYASATFYKAQAEFFCGAMCALDEVPPYWGISIMSGREIIDKYELA